MHRVRAHSLECALQDLKHMELITQIVHMHCHIEEIRKEAKKEKELDWQKMTPIAEDNDHINIGKSTEKAISRNKKNNKRG